MPIFATAGSKVYIGSTIAVPGTGTLNAASFTSQSWTEIGSLETIGSFGDAAEEVAISIVGNARKQKLKGTRDAGNMELVAAIDYADAGQIAVLAAEAQPHNYAFKVQFNDAPVDGTASERMFAGMVMSAREQLDGADNVMKINMTVGINSNVVRVAAAEA